MSTHHQLLYHIVFSTKYRHACLSAELRPKVCAYMVGVCKKLDGFALIINGHVDHLHLLVRIPTKISVADFVGKVKANSSKNLNDSKELDFAFAWQDGYGAFTVSMSNKDRVYQYISNQEQHHLKQSFQDEYLGLLAKHEVDFDPKYVFE